MDEKNEDNGLDETGEKLVGNWFEYLGNWSKLRRKNLQATLLSLAAISTKISKATSITSDTFLQRFCLASDLDSLQKQKEKCKHVRAFLQESDYTRFRKTQQKNLAILTSQQLEWKNEAWYNAVDEKGKQMFPWVYPQSKLNVITSKTTEADIESMIAPPKYLYRLPGYDKADKTKDDLAIGFSVERIGSKGKGKKELFRPSGIAVIDIGHMNHSQQTLDKGFMCQLVIADSGNNRVQLWTYQCSPYFPKSLGEKGGFEENIAFEGFIGTATPTMPHGVQNAVRHLENRMQGESKRKLKDIAEEEKRYMKVSQWRNQASKLQNTHGYHKGQFVSPTYVSVDINCNLQISDNDSEQIGSPRIQVFSHKDKYFVPTECIDNNTNVLAISRKQAKLYLNEESNPLRQETNDSFYFLDVNGYSHREINYSDYIKMNATVGGKILKGVAWTFPRVKRPYKLENMLMKNLHYKEFNTIQNAFDCLNNEGKVFHVGETEKTIQKKTQSLKNLLKNRTIYGSWLFPNEILISYEATLKSGQRQPRNNANNKLAFLVTNIAPSIAKSIFEIALEGYRSKTDGEHKREPQHYILDLPGNPSQELNLIFTIAAIKELNNKLLLRIVCTLRDADQDKKFTGKQNVMSGENIKVKIIATLRAKFISSIAFKKVQQERLNSLWKMWNCKRPSRIKLHRKSRKGVGKNNMILEFSSINEYRRWKRNMQKKYNKEKQRLESRLGDIDEASRKKFVKESLASMDNGKRFWKKPIKVKNKHVETLEDHKKQLVSEINVLMKNIKIELNIINEKLSKIVGSHAKELQYEKRCLVVSLTIFRELQKNDKNIYGYLKDCEKEYLKSSNTGEVIEDKDDSETHLHIHALVSLLQIISKQKSIQSKDSIVERVNVVLGEFMHQQYQKCLYVAGVNTLRDLIEDLISNQEKSSHSTRFFFVPTSMGKDLDNISKPYLLSYESLVGRNIQGKVKLASGNKVWTEGKVLAIDRETGLYVFIFFSKDETRHVRLLPRDDLRDRVPTYQPIFKKPWGTATLNTMSLNVLAVADHDQDCIHFFNNHNDHKIRNSLDTHSGSYLYTIGYTGKNKGQLRSPKGMVFDSFGRLLVADSANDRIQGFIYLKDPTGRTAGQWVVDIMHPEKPSPGDPIGLCNPSDIAVDSYDHYVVADTGHHCIKIFNRAVNYGPYELEDVRNIAKTDLWQFDSRPNGKARRRIPKIYLECLCCWGTQGHMLGSMIEPIGVACVTVPSHVKTVQSNMCNGTDPDEKYDEERVFVCDRSLHCIHMFKYTPGMKL